VAATGVAAVDALAAKKVAELTTRRTCVSFTQNALLLLRRETPSLMPIVLRRGHNFGLCVWFRY
jgi:hypothetical protein